MSNMNRQDLMNLGSTPSLSKNRGVSPTQSPRNLNVNTNLSLSKQNPSPRGGDKFGFGQNNAANDRLNRAENKRSYNVVNQFNADVNDRDPILDSDEEQFRKNQRSYNNRNDTNSRDRSRGGQSKDRDYGGIKYSNNSPRSNRRGKGKTADEILEDISNTIQQKKIDDLEDCFRANMHERKLAVELSEFEYVLGGRTFRLKDDDIYTLINEFEIKCKHRSYDSHNERFIDLDKLMDSLPYNRRGSQVSRYGKKKKQLNNGTKAINRVREEISEIIHYDGEGLLEVFEKMDIKNNNFISQNDLRKGLEKLGIKLNADEYEDLMEVIDENGDNKISFIEFQQAISTCDGGKTVTDRSHPFYTFFEDIRRKEQRMRKSLLEEAFGIRRSNKNDNVMIRWKDFLRGLEKINVSVRKNLEDDLYDFLDVKANRDEVNYKDFVALVGIGADLSHDHGEVLNKHKSYDPKDKKSRQIRQSDTKEVMRALIQSGVEVKQARFEFKNEESHRGKGEIDKHVFEQILGDLCDRKQRVGKDKIQTVSSVFQTKDRNIVNYEEFLNSLNSSLEMNKTLAYIFEKVDRFTEPNSRSPASDVLLKYLGLRKETELDDKQLNEALNKLHITLKNKELDMIMYEYDDNGEGKYFNLRQFDDDFQEWKTKEYKDSMYGNKKNRYNNYDRWNQNSNRNTKYGDLRHLEKFQPMLQDIVAAINKRRSGTLQWFKQYSEFDRRSGINVVSFKQFEKGLRDLNIPEQSSWNRNAEDDLYRAIQNGSKDDLDLNDIDDVLQNVKTKETRKDTKDEQVLEEFIRSTSGDSRYIEQEYNNMAKNGKNTITIKMYASYMLWVFPKSSKVILRDMEDMLSKYGQVYSSYSKSDELDIRTFKQEYEKLRDIRRIRADIFKKENPAEYTGGKSNISNNPLMPGNSITQTKEGINKREGERKMKPRNYETMQESQSSRAEPPKAYDKLMMCCYLKDKLVEDYFNQFSNPGRDRLQNLDKRAWSKAIDQLDTKWKPKEVENVFDWIYKSYNEKGSGLQEITTEQIDMAVYYETKKSIPQIQENVLYEVSSIVHKSKIDVEQDLRNEARKVKKSVEDLTIQDVCYYMKDTIRIKDIPFDELEVFVKRYENTKNGYKVFELNRLVDDFRSGKMSKPGSDTRQTKKIDPKQIEQVKRKVNDQLERSRDGYEGLSRNFSQAARGSSNSGIKEDVFVMALEQSGIKLQRDEESILIDYYYISREKTVDYRKLLEDLKRLGGSRGGFQKVTLTNDQKDLIKELKKYMQQNSKAPAQLMMAFKKKDRQNKGYLSMFDIQDACKDADLGRIFDDRYSRSNRYQEFCDCTSSNSQGLYSYKELMDLIVGESEGYELFTADIKQLQTGQYHLHKHDDDEWQPPRNVYKPYDNIMGNIGEQLIDTYHNSNKKVNYEKELLKASENSNLINRKQLDQAFRNMNIKLERSYEQTLTSFFKDNQNGTNQIKLTDFMKAVGLEYKIIGKTGVAKNTIKLLTKSELKQAQEIIWKIKEECRKLKISPMQMFRKGLNSDDDIYMRANAFTDVIFRELGQRFYGDIEIDRNVSLLVSYLQEDIPNSISYGKLNLAVELKYGEDPLDQHGAKEDKQYRDKLKRQLTSEMSSTAINDFRLFLTNKRIGIQKFLKSEKDRNARVISEKDFSNALIFIGYNPKNKSALIKDLQDSRKEILVEKIQSIFKKAAMDSGSTKLNQAQADSKLSRFSPKIQGYINQISRFLEKEMMTTSQLHKELDANRDGKVSKQEFVQSMKNYKIEGLVVQDLAELFDQLCIGGNEELNLEEFSLFIKGAQKKKQERLKEMDKDTLYKMEDEINELFNQFDEDGNGYVSAEEIYTSFQAFGITKTIEQCRDLIKQGGGGREGLDKIQFNKLMLPFMQEEMIGNQENMEKLRQVFLDCDTDNSGTLSIDELWNAVKKMGAEVSHDEVINLMSEIDADRSGYIDINEFMSLMQLGDECTFHNHGSSSTLNKIQMARHLSPADFLKSFKDIPRNFTPSFMTERWNKQNKNKPSSVFKAQVDPNTMLWKDILDPNDSSLHSELWRKQIESGKAGKKSQPSLRSRESTTSCLITFNKAEGVPLPQQSKDGTGFKDENIVKRAVRIAIEHTPPNGKPEIVHNAIQIPAIWRPSAKDVWEFDKQKDPGLTAAFFRTIKQDNLDKGNCRLLFELVVYVKDTHSKEENVTEMCCGWCEVNINQLNSGMPMDLEIQGGNPRGKMELNEIRDERSGFNANNLKKIFNTKKTQSYLGIKIQILKSLEQYQQLHLELMPSTCLVHQSLLLFMSGFMNYKAKVLLQESQKQSFIKPSGDHIIASLPGIYDCPDIVEQLSNIWTEDIFEPHLKKDATDLGRIVDKTKEFISRLYPILYSNEFKNILNGKQTSSAIGYTDQNDKNMMPLIDKRKNLILSALRYETSHTVKMKENKAPSDLTEFKPFSLKELDYDVWDTSKAKQEMYREQLKARGLYNDGTSNSARGRDTFKGYQQEPPRDRKVTFQQY